MRNSIPFKKLTLICLSFFMILVASCSLVNNDDKNIRSNKEGIYEGIYLQGIEDSWFNPCIDEDESWRPLFTEETFRPVRDALNDAQSYRVFVKAKGIPSKKGKYKGWFAEYDREFEITKVIAAIGIDSGKCP